MILEVPFMSRVSDDWLVSRAAGILFAVSAFIVLALTPLSLGVASVPDTLAGTMFVAILGIVGALSIFFVWMGMWRYWVRIDRSKPALKRLSFVVLLVGFWYGAILYFIYQYLWRDRRMRLRNGGGSPNENA
jgi:succinate dehydrogenase hydrophobic anchor subunit